MVGLDQRRHAVDAETRGQYRIDLVMVWHLWIIHIIISFSAETRPEWEKSLPVRFVVRGTPASPIPGPAIP